MPWLSSAYGYMAFTNPNRPYQPTRLNRVDAYPHLIPYHDPTPSAPKPAKLPTKLLPSRTKIPVVILDRMWSAQSHAYYEEIGSVPAAAVGDTSPFPEGHWYVIHPLLPTTVRGLTVKILHNVKAWVEGSGGVFVGTHPQVEAFREKRGETLRLVGEELERRDVRGVGEKEGYLGAWEEVDDYDLEGMGAFEGLDGDLGGDYERVVGPRMDRKRSETLMEQGFETADRMAMNMVENLGQERETGAEDEGVWKDVAL